MTGLRVFFGEKRQRRWKKLVDMILEYQKNIHCGCEVQELQSILGALLAGYPETLKQGSKEPELVRNGEVFFCQISRSFQDFK